MTVFPITFLLPLAFAGRMVSAQAPALSTATSGASAAAANSVPDTAATQIAQAQSGSSVEPPRIVEWRYGAFADLAYVADLNSPSNHLFRSRGTTNRVDKPVVNMAGGYLRKGPSESSRWGLELTAHAGEDSKIFGFSATAPNIHGADWLRQLGPTNASYLAPVGKGLTVQGGIFSSFIGYDGLYAKDNLTYTRPWTADFTPYLMLGVNASYPVTEKLTLTGFVLNGYWHLARANNVPSFGGQAAYSADRGVTVKQTLLYGPHQANTSIDLWRVLSNTIVERKTDRLTAALDFHVSTERVDVTGKPRAWWVAGQLPVRLTIHAPLSVTFRPEFARDSDGRWTTFEQTVTAFTTNLEYRALLSKSQAILRLEHRYDRSTGPGGGFFKDVQPGVVGLTPEQHLLTVAVVFTLDATSHR